MWSTVNESQPDNAMNYRAIREHRGNYRNKQFLDAAEGEACTMNSPWCNADTSKVVACHSDEQVHGKGRGIKAHDIFIFFGCSGCHAWYGSSDIPRSEKREAFHYAHARTIQRLIDKGLLK